MVACCCAFILTLATLSTTALAVEQDFLQVNDDILNWADRHGVNRSAVDVQTFSRSNGTFRLRGIAATRDIEGGEVILAVGALSALTSWSVPSVRACRGLWDQVKSDHHRLLLHLVLQRSLGNASMFHEYIRSLPSLDNYARFHPHAAKEAAAEFSDLPMMKAETDWMDGLASLQELTNEFRESRTRNRACFEAGLPLLGDFLWAECVVFTRAYDYDRDDIGGAAIVPLVDFSNFPESYIDADGMVRRGQANAFWNDDGVLIAAHAIKRGEEITDWHGVADVHSVTDVFDSFGFLPDAGFKKAKDLSRKRCSRLRTVIDKYLGQGSCTAGPVRCNLAKLAKMSCSSHESSEL